MRDEGGEKEGPQESLGEPPSVSYRRRYVFFAFATSLGFFFMEIYLFISMPAGALSLARALKCIEVKWPSSAKTFAANFLFLIMRPAYSNTRAFGLFRGGLAIACPRTHIHHASWVLLQGQGRP